MKKAIQFIASLLATVTLASGVASAQLSCEISDTGRNSDNSCTVKSDTECKISNDNKVDVDNDNDQNAESGNANSSDNRGGGDATSGDASNSNNTSTVIDIVNEGDCEKAEVSKPRVREEAARPAVVARAEAEAEQPVGGAGAEEVAAVGVLPVTGAPTPAETVGAAMAFLGGLAIATRVGASIASRFTK